MHARPVLFLALLLLLLLSPAMTRAALERHLSGNAQDAMGDTARLAGPLLNLGGGGPDVDEAFRAMIDGVRGCAGGAPQCPATLDVVVLRAAGGSGYNDYILAMPGVDSVETLVIRAAADALLPEVDATVRAAEVVFFAGGDQCDYVKLFRGTPLEAAVESVYARGGAVGGTSAGMAIQSPVVYDACTASARSPDILADPYHASASFSEDFFAWPAMEATIADQHFVTRDRMGRLLGFLARRMAGAPAPGGLLGVAADEATSILVDGHGQARVLGSGNAYFVAADHAPGERDARERVAPGRPLTYIGFRVWRIAPGNGFDLRDRDRGGWYAVDVLDGAVRPPDPY